MAWRAHLAEGNRTQARKRVGADVVLRDDLGRVLLVDPSYKPDWDMPGGMCEANEPPADTVRREIREELSLEIDRCALLCVDWVSPHGPWDDSLIFVFDGGILKDEQVSGVKLTDGELNAFEFCSETQAEGRLRPYVFLRLMAASAALSTGRVVYLHDGLAVSE